MEEIGDQIVNELYRRSFIQDVEKVKFDDINYFKMHDLVYDLAQSIIEDECRIVNVGDNARPINLSKRVHHLTCCTSVDIPSAQSLRTFLVLHNGKIENTYDLKFSSLRAFDARFFNTSTPVLALIGNLKHLQYLNPSLNLSALT